MEITDLIALVLMVLGALLTLVASVGLQRFPDVLTRMHAASKPQTLGLVLILAGVALAIGSFAGAAIMVLVVLAQMVTVPVSSTLLARAAFRRGFVSGGSYAVDELSPRLARSLDEDDDEDGFIDEVDMGADDHGFGAEHDRFPTNVVQSPPSGADLSQFPNWDEPETTPLVEPEELDIDEEDLVEAEDVPDREAHARREAIGSARGDGPDEGSAGPQGH
ncbi:monovalent cation/H(+) antiporter subunit G [Brachybacterium sp. AOP25-B2-12]|uniref:monovalent cation/H(+) antiporter subunit G n=1 Tax=Brachybacterium sp. AOP25-B2-12 TaxID=3457710 RepID=UPI004034CE09